MAGEWQEYPLPEVIDFREGPGILARDFREEGTPLIRLAGLDRGASLLAGCNYLDPGMVEKRWPHFRLAKGDTLLSTSASLGRIAIVSEAGQGAIPYTGIIRMRPRDGRLCSEYIRYLLEGPEFQQQIEMMGVGSVIRHFGPLHLRQMTLSVPPLEEQRAIAHILGSLDAKMELNRRMNETLEEIARTIFKSWFVDFDPVRAKAEGRDIGLPEHIADLFPDRFEDSELGEIPAEWSVRSFAETVNILGGGTPKTSVPEYWGGAIPWFSVVDAPRDADVFVVDTEKKTTQAGIDNSSARILPQGTTIISARGTVGRVALVSTPMAMNQSCYGLQNSASKYGYYTYYATRNLVAIFQQRAHGAVFDTITRDTLRGIWSIVPNRQLIDTFETEIAPIMNRIMANLHQSKTLSEIRDAMLPKFISGELRVDDAKQLTDETMP